MKDYEMTNAKIEDRLEKAVKSSLTDEMKRMFMNEARRRLIGTPRFHAAEFKNPDGSTTALVIGCSKAQKIETCIWRKDNPSAYDREDAVQVVQAVNKAFEMYERGEFDYSGFIEDGRRK